jgi:hypothetical protein
VFANHSFSMPGRTATQNEDRLYPENWFPFGTAIVNDLAQVDAVLQHQVERAAREWLITQRRPEALARETLGVKFLLQ